MSKFRLNTTGMALAILILPLIAYYAIPLLMEFGYYTANFIEHAPWQELVAVAITIYVALVVLGDIILIWGKVLDQRKKSGKNGHP